MAGAPALTSFTIDLPDQSAALALAGPGTAPGVSRPGRRSHSLERAAIQVLEFQGFPRISLIFLICIRLFAKMLLGNWGPVRSWEVLGGPRKS